MIRRRRGRRLVFLTPPEERADDEPEPYFRGHERMAGVLALAVIVIVGWWLFVPPTVHRPASAVWCPAGSPAARFDARRILGRKFDEGYDLALKHRCVVRDVGDGVDDDGATNRINVDVSRGIITRIVGVY
jgi:hypothetical protein